MTHIGIEFGSNEIRAVRLSRDHSHVEAFIDRPLNAPPSGFAFSETLRSALADLGVTAADPVAIAVAIGRSGSGISSDSGIADFLDELGNRLGEPLVQVADRLGRVAYAPAPSLALVQSAFGDTGFVVESIELPPVAAARLVPDGSPGVLRLHSGVDWAARIVGGQLVEALAAPIRDSTEGVLWHPSAGHSQLITDFPIGCDLPGRDRPLAGVAIGAAIGLSRSTRPLQLNRDPGSADDGAIALTAQASRTPLPEPIPARDPFQRASASSAPSAVATPTVVEDDDVAFLDTPAAKSRTRTGRRAAKKALADPAVIPPSNRAEQPGSPATGGDWEPSSANPTSTSPRVEDTAAAEEMIARARSRAKDTDVDEPTAPDDSAGGDKKMPKNKKTKNKKSARNKEKANRAATPPDEPAEEPTTDTDSSAAADDATADGQPSTDEAATAPEDGVDAEAEAAEAATTPLAPTAPADAAELESPIPTADAPKETPPTGDSLSETASTDEAPAKPPSPAKPDKSAATTPLTPLGDAPSGRVGQRSPSRPLFEVPPPADDGSTPAPAPLSPAEPLAPSSAPAAKRDVLPTPPSTDSASRWPKLDEAPPTPRLKADNTALAASSSLTQRLRDDQAKQSESDAPKPKPETDVAPKRAADRSHLSVARAKTDSTERRGSDRAARSDESFGLGAPTDDTYRDTSFDHDSIDRDVAELAGFGAALAQDDYYFDDADDEDEFESGEFDSGDLSIDEILAEGRRREASYAAAAQPRRPQPEISDEEVQTQRALDAERAREIAATAQVTERQRVPAAPMAAAPASTTIETKGPAEKTERVPGSFQSKPAGPKASAARLRALPQPRQDDRVRPPEAARATPPPSGRRGLPLPLMAFFAFLSVTALVFIVTDFDSPPDRTTTTDAAPTADAIAEETATEAAPTAAAADADGGQAEPTAGEEPEASADASSTQTQQPAVSLDDLAPHSVTMADGVITLEGPLPNQEILDLFAERAVDAVGEANVVNNMVVHPDAPPPDDGNVRVDSAVVFTTGGTEIPTQYAATINQTVALMQLYPDVSLIIEGHSDSDGTPEQKVRFSENRANAIVAWLAAAGVSPDRMSVVGYGDARPVASNDTDEGKAANRRVDLEYVDLLAG